MIVRFLKPILLLGSLLAFTLAGNAESLLANVHVPFAFFAGGKLLPAGDYTIQDTEMSGVLLIRGAAGTSVVVMSIPGAQGRDAATATVTFERHGAQLYLAGVEAPVESVRLYPAAR